jgi:polysaccharide biosynthesis/export protein
VMDVPELSRQYRVTTAGMIEVPLLKKPIAAAGLTPEQLAQTIREKLQAAGMVNDPFVTVQVTSSRSHTVTIAGAVKTPQIFPVPSQITLLDAISQAGGLATDAGETAIVARGEVASRVLRLDESGSGGTGGESTPGHSLKVDLKRLMEDGDPTLNLVLYPGDRVTVQRAGVVYVVGAVIRAGGFVLANEGEHMTVLRAIALADNVKNTAATKRAVIIRKDSKTRGGTEQIPLNLNRILDGHEPDQQLLADDILFVPDSAGKKALIRAGEAAAQAASLMIYRVP